MNGYEIIFALGQILGGSTGLGLLTVVVYRMGYRRIWLALPWAAALFVGIIVFLTAGSDRYAVDYSLVLARAMTVGCGWGNLITVAVLAIIGVKRGPSKVAGVA